MGGLERPDVEADTKPKAPSEMHSKITCHYDDHDYYADNVKYVHFFTPIETTVVSRQLFILIPSGRSRRKGAERKRQMLPVKRSNECEPPIAFDAIASS